MGEKVLVNISGTAFSLLLYENTKRNHDQEGFLLGEVITHRKRTITDNEQEVINIEHVAKVSSVFPCPRLAHFYSSSGKINETKLTKFLDTQKEHVIGWFKFRHSTSFKLTLREKIVMKQLATFFLPDKPELFTCALLTAQTGSEVELKHILSQTFIRYYKSTYQALPMHISNLTDPHDVYKVDLGCSNMFKQMVKSLKIDLKKSQGYSVISRIESSFETHIAKVVAKLGDEEKKLHSLEQEVQSLRDKLSTLESFNDELEEMQDSIVEDLVNIADLSTSSEETQSPMSYSDTLQAKRGGKRARQKKSESPSILSSVNSNVNEDRKRNLRSSFQNT